jgi:hypothetical protein
VAEFLEQVAWASTSVAAIAAGASAVYAARGYRQGRRLALEERGHATYSAYLALAFENPQYSTVNDPKQLAGLKTRDRGEAFERYEWYVSRMLWAFEQILEISTKKAEPEWHESIRAQLRLHWPYLCGDFRRAGYAGDYAEPLKGLLEAVTPGSSNREAVA